MKTVCPRQYNKACSPKEGGKFTTIWRFSIRPDLANNLSDSGTIADEIQRKFPGGVDKVLEMNGTVTLEDSLHCPKQGGIVCMTGIVGNQWSFDRFAPMDAIPTGAYLTVQAGGSADFMRTPLNELARQIEADTLHIQAGKICAMDDIASAPRLMKENKKLVELLLAHRESLKGRDDDDETKS